MKFCKVCGDEIGTRDGENVCPECERVQDHKSKLAKRRKQRRERESVLRDLGLIKVRGAMGGVYWE